MSTIDTDLDTHEDDGDSQNGPKPLRDKLKKIERELDDLRKENADLKVFKRSSDLEKLLDAAGAPRKLAKYAARDIEDVSADTVQEWLKENGEDFGWAAQSTGELDDVATQQQRISRATDQAPPTQPGNSAALLHRLQTEDYSVLKAEGLVP